MTEMKRRLSQARKMWCAARCVAIAPHLANTTTLWDFYFFPLSMHYYLVVWCGQIDGCFVLRGTYVSSLVVLTLLFLCHAHNCINTYAKVHCLLFAGAWRVAWPASAEHALAGQHLAATACVCSAKGVFWERVIRLLFRTTFLMIHIRGNSHHLDKIWIIFL